MAQFFTRKSIATLEAEASEPEVQALTAHNGVPLKRSLSAVSLVALGIGAIIGAGIFVLTGHAAAANAGPAITLSFVLGGTVCAFAGLCYAEMASAVPVAGSAYTYAYATMGELIAWIIGWDLILEYALGSTTVAIGWSGYVVSFLADFGIAIPAAYSSSPLVYDAAQHVWHLTGAIINAPAMAVIALIAALLVFGVRETARVNNIIVAIKLVIVVLFIGAAARFVSTAHWVTAANPAGHFIPPNLGPGEFGLSGVLRGAAVVFFAYIGFDAVSTTAQEAINPKRDMPIGILGSLVICTILYVAVSAVATGIVPYKELGVPDPIAVAMDRTGIPLITWVVKFGALAGLTTAMLVLLFGQTRVFYAMAQDGLLPPLFARLHDKYRTPAISQWLVGLLTALTAGLLPIDILDEMVSIGTLAAFALVCFAVLYLRRHSPAIKRPFRAPGIPYLPILGIVSCLALMAALPIETWIRLVVWMALGLTIYFLYGVKHARR